MSVMTSLGAAKPRRPGRCCTHHSCSRRRGWRDVSALELEIGIQETLFIIEWGRKGLRPPNTGAVPEGVCLQVRTRYHQYGGGGAATPRQVSSGGRWRGGLRHHHLGKPDKGLVGGLPGQGDRALEGAIHPTSATAAASPQPKERAPRTRGALSLLLGKRWPRWPTAHQPPPFPSLSSSVTVTSSIPTLTLTAGLTPLSGTT